MIPIAQATTLPSGCPIDGIQGQVTKVFPRKEGVNGRGKPYSIQALKVKDNTGEIEIKIWNKPDLTSITNQTLFVGQNSKKEACTLEREDYQGKQFTKVVCNDSAVILVNGQPVAGGPPAQAPAPQFQQPAPQPQPYQPAPGAYEPQLFVQTGQPYVPPQAAQVPYQPQPVQQPAPVAPTANAPMNFTAFINGAENVDKVEAALRESTGLHHRCLLAAHASLDVAYRTNKIEFQSEDICAVAATLFIDLGKRGFSPVGFSLKQPRSAVAQQPQNAQLPPQPHDQPSSSNQDDIRY